MEWKFKKNEKWNKVILVVLCGILLLVIVMPQKTVQTAVGQTGSSSDTTASYEVRLRELLADTYGADMVDVLIYAGDRTQTYYGSDGTETITGVLITIKRKRSQVPRLQILPWRYARFLICRHIRWRFW